MDLVDTLTAAGIRTYDITESTDGSVEIALGDGGVARVGPAHIVDDCWYLTVYEGDGTLNRDESVNDLRHAVREVVQLYRLSARV